ncbi:MAG: hypothetical protein ACI9MC_001922 [Kiritimatiellia bacterium]|jgi:hypothetical protein
MTANLDIAQHVGPMVITLVYILLYYGLQINILRVKNSLVREYRERGERFDRYFGDDRKMLAADRMQLNMLEHMPPFLALLWLNALFVGPFGATIAGSIYLTSRLLYPVLLGSRVGRGVRGKILYATVPGYAVTLYFAVRLVLALLVG